MDELDTIIEEMATRISKKYSWLESTIYEGIMNEKKEIRTWLKANKTKLIKILKRL